jgi:DNA-binding MarR family transcriptional regulator
VASAESKPSAIVPALYAIARHLRRACPPDTLDIPATMVLHRVAATESIRPRRLAEELRLDQSTVSRHVAGLEQQGLLTRTPDPDDGRACRLTLTDAGTALLADGIAHREHAIDAATRHWDAADRDQLAALLQRLSADLDATTQPERTETP